MVVHPPHPSMPSPLVLLVEDHADTREMYALFLVASGLRVTQADNGLQAYENAIAAPPDIVVADLAVPGLDGFELCARLRQHECTRDVPILALTGRYFQPADLAQARRVGCDSILIKPCLPDALLAEIDRLLALAPDLRLRARNRRESAVTLRQKSGVLQQRSRDIQARPRPSFRVTGPGQYAAPQMVVTPKTDRREELLRDIKREYLRAPNLKLSFSQAQHLWALEITTCEQLLSGLVQEKFLSKAPDGAYALSPLFRPRRLG